MVSKENNVAGEQSGDGRNVARNAVYQIGGRFTISAGKLAVAILLIRYTGAER